MPVFISVMVTLASGTVAPEVSVTVPKRLPVTACPYRIVAKISPRIANGAYKRTDRILDLLKSFNESYWSICLLRRGSCQARKREGGPSRRGRHFGSGALRPCLLLMYSSISFRRA